MATLVENVNRVVSALNDIKNALINKGVEPTGKCETFADAIDQIPTGTQVYVGNLALPAGTGKDYFVEVGFRPTKIFWVRVAQATPTSPNNDVRYMYDNLWGDFSFYSTTSRTPSKVAFTSNTQLCINRITDTGFQLRQTNALVNFKIYAIGEVTEAQPLTLDGEEE